METDHLLARDFEGFLRRFQKLLPPEAITLSQLKGWSNETARSRVGVSYRADIAKVLIFVRVTGWERNPMKLV